MLNLIFKLCKHIKLIFNDLILYLFINPNLTSIYCLIEKIELKSNELLFKLSKLKDHNLVDNKVKITDFIKLTNLPKKQFNELKNHFIKLDLNNQSLSKANILDNNKLYTNYLAIYLNQLNEIKQFNKEQLKKFKIVYLIENELKLLNSINFNNYFLLFNLFCEDELNYYFIFKYDSNLIKLTGLLDDNGLDEDFVKFITAQLILIIEYLHGANIILRSLDLNTILINLNGYIKITDLSYFYILDFDELSTNKLDSKLNYLPPEYLITGRFTKKSDYWLLGCIILHLNTGKLPFNSDRGLICILAKIMSNKRNFLFNKSFYLNNLLNKLLIVDPSLRLDNLSLLTHKWLIQIDFNKLFYQNLEASKNFLNFLNNNLLLAK